MPRPAGIAAVGLTVLFSGLAAYLLTAELRHARRFAKALGETDTAMINAAGRHVDVSQLQALYSGTLTSWCNGDGEAYGSAFTEDAIYIGFDGSITRGRGQIARWHQQLFDKWLANSCLHGRLDEIRFVGRDGAILLARGATSLDGGPLRRPSIQTYIAIRTGEGWRFDSFQNGRVENQTPVGLAWLGFKTAVLGL